jgi:hypothetical protein
VIDGTDGRAHHVRFRGIEAFAHAPSGRAVGLNFCNRTARLLALYIQVDRRESWSDRPGLIGEMPGTIVALVGIKVPGTGFRKQKATVSWLKR